MNSCGVSVRIGGWLLAHTSTLEVTQLDRAGVAKLADAQDLKSWDSKESCGFDSRPRHQILAFSPGCESWAALRQFMIGQEVRICECASDALHVLEADVLLRNQ